MPGFLVAANPDDPATRVDKMDMAVVFAADAADARAMAKARFSGDGDTSWDNAVTTQLVATADFLGWRFRVRAAAPTGPGGPDVIDETYVGIASDGPDEMGVAMAALLVAAGLTSTYTAATQVLIVATGAGADDLGDHTLLAELIPPAASFADDDAIPGFITAQTHEGVAAANLDCTLAADAYVIPNLVGIGKQS